MKPLSIVGSDTGVGKTILIASLAAYQSVYNPAKTLAIYKPVQAGIGDREYFKSTFNLKQSLAEITPIFLETPLAPAIAALREDKTLDLGLIWQHFQTLQNNYDCLLVETFGGLGSPLTYEYTVADLAKDWHIPTVLVVPVKLGAIAQAVANVALAKINKIDLKGIVLNCLTADAKVDDLAPIDLIQALTYTPVLGVIPYINDLQNIEELARVASNLQLSILGL